jgi:hypothetical protein
MSATPATASDVAPATGLGEQLLAALDPPSTPFWLMRGLEKREVLLIFIDLTSFRWCQRHALEKNQQ